MRRIASIAIASALAAACTTAGSTEWLCNLSEDLVNLICVADVDLASVAPVAAAETARSVVRGTAYPLDATLEYRISLWSPPSDPEWIATLAQATICYRTTDCEVMLVPSTWNLYAQARVAPVRRGWKTERAGRRIAQVMPL